MKKVKNWGLMLSMAVPGFFAYSCTGTMATKMRDAVVDGTSDVVEVATFQWLNSFVPEPDQEAGG